MYNDHNIATRETDTRRGNRPRLLVSAYACAADRGSEAGGGWHRLISHARHFETWAICEESEFKPLIQDSLAKYGPIDGLHFYFVPQHMWESWLWRLPGLGYFAYRRWQHRAWRLGQRLHQHIQFDVAQQLTFGTFREPGYLWKLGIPFVWGPFGGAQNYPWRFLVGAGIRGGVVELLRSCCNWWQLHFSRRVRRAGRNAAIVLAANSETRQAMRRYCENEPVLFSDIGISQVVPASDRMPSSGTLRLLWVARCERNKALWLLLDALAGASSELDWHLRVVGDGREKRRWQRRAQQLGIDGQIDWLGPLSYTQTQQQYKDADIFVFTSLRDTSGNVLLEAMAAGVPVICLDHQGAHDIVSDRAGVRIPVSHPAQVKTALATALSAIAADRELHHALRVGAIATARNYLWSAQGDRLAKMCRAVVPSPQRETPPHGGGRPPRQFTDRISMPTTASLPRRCGTAAAIALRAVCGRRARRHVGILLYHRVAPAKLASECPADTISVERFRIQLTGLLDRGFTPCSLDDLMRLNSDGGVPPERGFVVTIDDGYQCIYRHAMPVLAELNIPATVFLATEYLDTSRPMTFGNEERGTSRVITPDLWCGMTSDQCRELAATELVSFGSHTHTHRDFRATPDLLTSDIHRSVTVLRQRFNVERIPFAYPYGYDIPNFEASLREAGVACALNIQAQLVDVTTSPYGWGRFIVDPGESPVSLAAKLDGWYGPLQSAWSGIRRLGAGAVIV